MTEKRKYPIVGTDFFTQIMDDNGYYIDKTDVIPWILARKKRVILFTRPRRFGKSMMMSMLKALFEYRLDRDGKPVDNRHYFENLMVSKDAEAMAQLGALKQIENKQYFNVMDKYQGDLLLVDVKYDEKTNEHKCEIQRFVKNA
ncbi:MAG: AAA family ATPase [Proteobacteria bacterium]|nr:AAA family ATPase [Pseudomonadota bacterium]